MTGGAGVMRSLAALGMTAALGVKRGFAAGRAAGKTPLHISVPVILSEARNLFIAGRNLFLLEQNLDSPRSLKFVLRTSNRLVTSESY
jgi:hypothetical protein